MSDPLNPYPGNLRRHIVDNSDLQVLILRTNDMEGLEHVRDIYEAELQSLRSQVEAMRVAGSAMEGLVMSAQSFLAKHLPPDGTSEKETISELLGLLDGPHQRNVQKAWTASLNPTPTIEPK